ncbi:MAG TPA: class I SAM-dependent methyltransferase [Trebonia sp.]
MTGHSAHADQVQALFDGKAAGWSAKYAPDGRLAGRLTRLAEAVDARVRVGGDLLDLGCGSGELARHLAASGYRVVGCDIAPRMLCEAAAADAGRTVAWIRLDPRWQALPFAAAGLDAVVAASVLEYVPDPSAVLRECARVLRPGGVLLCTVPDAGHAVRWLEWPLAWVARMPLGGLRAGGWPRLASYLTYLRISRHRRAARWWHAAGRRAGLLPVPGQATGKSRAPLRLLTFTRPEDTSGRTFSASNQTQARGNRDDDGGND